MNEKWFENLPGPLRAVVEDALRSIVLYKPFMFLLSHSMRGKLANVIGHQLLDGIKKVGWDLKHVRLFLNDMLRDAFELTDDYKFGWDDDPPE